MNPNEGSGAREAGHNESTGSFLVNVKKKDLEYFEDGLRITDLIVGGW